MTFSEPRVSPINDRHAKLGAKFTMFGGWSMPLSYPSGTVAEHLACRQSVAVFDVSHLGTIRVQGADSLERLNSTLSNDITKIDPGHTQYTHLCDPVTGGVVDDIIVWWRSTDCFDLMPNASNTDRVQSVLGGTDVTDSRAVFALQGPDALGALSQLSPAIGSAIRPRAIVTGEIAGVEVIVAGTGYTGEHGVEIAAPCDGAIQVWDALTGAGAVPAGLGARDTLRLEAALPLHGHELSIDITPIEAGLSWVVGWSKPEFVGRQALLAARDNDAGRRSYGVLGEGRQPFRDGAVVLSQDTGLQVGTLTSGGYSPMLERGIGLGLMGRHMSVGDRVTVVQRDKELSATLTKGSFVALPSHKALAQVVGGN